MREANAFQMDAPTQTEGPLFGRPRFVCSLEANVLESVCAALKKKNSSSLEFYFLITTYVIPLNKMLHVKLSEFFQVYCKQIYTFMLS